MDALGALTPVVQTDCEPDDYDAFVKAVFDEIEAEQCVEEEDSGSDSDVEVVKEPPVISLNQAHEKMRELIVFVESRIDFRQNQAHREYWVEQLVSNAWQGSGPAHNVQGALRHSKKKT